MINALLRVSLQNRWLVLAAAGALVVFGSYRAANAKVDVFPDLTAPRVTIVTEATGMAAEEVETLVTFPLETAVNGTAGLRRVRSASAPGISLVWAEFDWDTSDSVARQRITERLQTLGDALPPEVAAPTLAPPSSVMGEVLFLAVTSDHLSEMELRRLVDVDLRRRLLAVRGVSQVIAQGGEVRQYQVLLDPQRMEAYGFTIEDVVHALEGGSQNAPGGWVVAQEQESVVRVIGRSHGTEDLSALVVATRGTVPIRLAQIAEVRVGAAPRRGTGSYNGEPAIILRVAKQPGADTLTVTAEVDRALDELEPTLAARGVVVHRDTFRQANFIERAVNNLVEVLRDGAILVIVLLFLFLWSWRPTVISGVAIPLSLLAAVLVLEALGLTLDTMTLGGLAIAVGELVDDAIVDVENVSRRLRERDALPIDERSTVIATVLAASTEVRSSIVSATAILGLVFLPLLFLTGLEGRLLRPLGIAFLVAIGASLLVAVTVTPVLCSYMLPKGIAKGEPPLIRWLVRGYRPVLRTLMARPWSAVSLALFVAFAGAAGLLGFGRSFLPSFNEGSLTIGASTLPGTSLSQSDELGAMAERALLMDPSVVSTARRTGRAERDEHVMGVESTEIEVSLREDGRSREQRFADIRELLSAVPGLSFEIGQPISHRIDHMISGQRSALAIKVVGDHLPELRRYAREVNDAIADTPGLVDLRVEQSVDVPQLVVRIDPEAAASYGLSTGHAAEDVSTALWGAVPMRIYEDSTTTDVVVRFPDDVREDLESVRSMRVPTPAGALVPVRAFASVQRDAGPNFIMREDVRRRIMVSANVAGADLRSVYEEVRRRVTEQVDLPDTVHVTYSGQFESEESATMRLLLLGLFAILGIALVVGATIGGVRRTLIVLINLPLSLAGGVIGVYVAGGVLSVATTIGFITLFGIATRNGILLATRAGDLELSGLPRAEAVERSATERLAPILMTAVTAALGLLPLSLALGEPGSEIQAPMALVILFGLITSTALNMLVVPPLLARWGGSSRGRTTIAPPAMP